MYKQIDDLAVRTGCWKQQCSIVRWIFLPPSPYNLHVRVTKVLIEMVAAAVQETNGKVEDAERELATPLQPLQAMLESLKMVRTFISLSTSAKHGQFLHRSDRLNLPLFL